MRHCQKIANGRSPSVRSHEEWNNFTKEVDQITGFTFFKDFSKNFRNMWLSATEGDQNNNLMTLHHWLETDSNNNDRMEAKEEVWRDFYYGERLKN